MHRLYSWLRTAGSFGISAYWKTDAFALWWHWETATHYHFRPICGPIWAMRSDFPHDFKKG